MKTITKIAIGGAGCLAAYLLWIRPRQLRWGATDEEVESALSGDDVVKCPHFNATRAITISANPEEIWPWLLQIGTTRAGFYSYDWIDNAGIPSAERILTEFQHIKVGDFIPMTPDAKHGMWVKDFRTNVHILWWDKKGHSTWLWQLLPIDKWRTRLLTRLRVRYTWTPPWVFFYLMQDVGDIVMMRKCMLGIKQRAETASKRSDRVVHSGHAPPHNSLNRSAG